MKDLLRASKATVVGIQFHGLGSTDHDDGRNGELVNSTDASFCKDIDEDA